ncbi:hypothetical protein [Sulfuriferula sp.]|uniref:head-tail connector protein n=1 Tax=Sulfuriferula sp. TaxID=2025307 RepID=UPI002730B67E|nr:hypothetical protein [Sulfuriferula sp.]MDP2026444.1 hypothetical protein [Sulfuriferula sp.]
MPVKLITPPTVEPVSLADARLHLRITGTSDATIVTPEDVLIKMLISSARRAAETITRRALITQQWQMVVDRFPSPMGARLADYWLGQSWGMAGMSGVSQFAPTDRTGYAIMLPFPPLATVDSIQYLDPAGVLQTLPPANYIVDTNSEPGRVVPAIGYAWPSTRLQINAVTVKFTVGYGATETSVPEGIRSWMLLMIATLYENRELVAVLQKGRLQELPYIDGLLDPYRIQYFA